MKVMLEMKGPSHDTRYYDSVERILRENDLLDGAYMIGIPEAKAYFQGKVRTSVQHEGLERAIAAGDDVARLYFLFEGARYLDKKTITLARAANVPIVAALNKHHYRGDESMQRALADVDQMKHFGVRSFQIDSVYDRWFIE